jgi:large subunit ribosomal protein L6
MSRVGKQPVKIASGVTITRTDNELTVTGPKGTLTKTFHPDITIQIEKDAVLVSRSTDDKYHRSLHGLTRALIQNMVTGVTAGYVKQLELVGVGYRGELKGRHLILYMGYSHSILVSPPDGVKLEFEHRAGLITVSGTDKQLVGLTADRIRNVRRPDPYKGKGIKYKGEILRRKAGKTAA